MSHIPKAGTRTLMQGETGRNLGILVVQRAWIQLYTTNMPHGVCVGVEMVLLLVLFMFMS